MLAVKLIIQLLFLFFSPLFIFSFGAYQSCIIGWMRRAAMKIWIWFFPGLVQQWSVWGEIFEQNLHVVLPTSITFRSFMIDEDLQHAHITVFRRPPRWLNMLRSSDMQRNWIFWKITFSRGFGQKFIAFLKSFYTLHSELTFASFILAQREIEIHKSDIF